MKEHDEAFGTWKLDTLTTLCNCTNKGRVIWILGQNVPQKTSFSPVKAYKINEFGDLKEEITSMLFVGIKTTNQMVYNGVYCLEKPTNSLHSNVILQKILIKCIKQLAAPRVHAPFFILAKSG